MKQSSLHSEMLLLCISESFRAVPEFKFTRTKTGKKHSVTMLKCPLTVGCSENKWQIIINYSWSLLRYLFSCLSWLSSIHSQGISGNGVKSADFAHVCHLQAKLRCWESSSHCHTSVSTHENVNTDRKKEKKNENICTPQSFLKHNDTSKHGWTSKAEFKPTWTSLQNPYWTELSSETLALLIPLEFSAGSALWYPLLLCQMTK